LVWNAGGTALENGPTTSEISSAQTYATNAAASASAASSSASTASTQAGLAATAKTNAETAETNAETAQAAAEAARDLAQGYAAAADVAKIEWQGAWQTSTAYALNDAVSNGGSSYICIVAHTSGTFATDLAAAKWELLAQKGTDGSGSLTSITAGTGLTGGTITTSGTIAVDVGTTAGKIVQLDGSAKLPAVDGSSLTNTAQLVANTFTAAQGCSTYGLTDGGTVTPDLSQPNEGYVVLGGNRALGFPSGLVAGKRQRFTFDVYQDATGSRTLSYAWCYCWAGGTVGTLTTTALACDKLFGDVRYYATSTVTITIAAPGVVSWTSHGLKTGDRLQLTTTGALPTGLSSSTTYFVIKNDANSFWLATSLANAAAGTKITTSGSQSGTHTAVACAIDVSLNKAFA
jgi:hypothetical protein